MEVSLKTRNPALMPRPYRNDWHHRRHLAESIRAQLYAALHVLALDQLEDDIALRRAGIESLKSLLIALFSIEINGNSLAHRHIEIVLGTVHTEGIGSKPRAIFPCWQGIGVHGDK